MSSITNKLRISVAMAVYNGSEFIVEQLDTIRLQSRLPDEVIVSDDSSTDDTYAIVEKYIAEYDCGEWLYLTKNSYGKGVQNNFYNAIKMTTGDIVLLCDQDDLWKKDKVSYIEKVMAANQEINCLNTGFAYIDKNGNPIFDKKRKKVNHGMILYRELKKGECLRIPFSMIINKNVSPGMTMALRRKVVNRYLNISSRSALHDWEMNCIASIGGVFFLNEILVDYRIHDKQTVSIGYLNRSILNRLSKKMATNSDDIKRRVVYLSEVSNVVTVKSDEACYISKYLRYLNARYDIAVESKWWKLGWLIYQNIVMKVYDKNVDMRLAFVDALTCILRKRGVSCAAWSNVK